MSSRAESVSIGAGGVDKMELGETGVDVDSPSSPLFNSFTSFRERDGYFYELVAGGARMKLLETALDLQVFEFIGDRKGVRAFEIISQLNLHPHRGWKFLHALYLSDFLLEEGGDYGSGNALYSLSDQTKSLFGVNGSGCYFFQDTIAYYRYLLKVQDLTQVVLGAPLVNMVQWPPKNSSAAEHLETWMRVTADGAIKTIVNSGALKDCTKLLDVGGGDATIGIHLVNVYKDQGLQVSVFNLPASAHLARQNIANHNCEDKVNVVEGDFIQDELPGGYDAVMFSRVLTDWNADVCKMLLRKAKNALKHGGKLIINEAFKEGNVPYFISWEFRYIYYDTFGKAVFKPVEVYEEILKELGFKIARVSPMIDDAFYSVIEAISI